jgi:hypothetical protein
MESDARSALKRCEKAKDEVGEDERRELMILS